MRWLIGLLLALLTSGALAQGCGQSNPNCLVPLRPPGDMTSAAASTQWVLTNISGGGSVNSFTAGALSPLFNTNVAAPTTNPNLTFLAISQNANLFYAGPASGGAAAPTFRTIAVSDMPPSTTQTVGSGTAVLGTAPIGSAACASVVTVSAAGIVSTDTLMASFNSDPTGVTGYIPATTGMLVIIPYPTTNLVNFKVCNNTSSAITPGAITLNWRVVR